MSDRPRLLIVDDDRAITSTVGPMLRELADVDTAHTVAEALEKLASHTYAACVLDLVLGDDPAPLHDALSSREVPTLLISGRDPAALGPLAEVRGWSYAAKPISPQVLRGLVAELLGVDAPELTQRGTRPSPAPSQADADDVSRAQQGMRKGALLFDQLVAAFFEVSDHMGGLCAHGLYNEDREGE
jgi:DNA-binding NtrC family response regulator